MAQAFLRFRLFFCGFVRIRLEPERIGTQCYDPSDPLIAGHLPYTAEAAQGRQGRVED